MISLAVSLLMIFAPCAAVLSYPVSGAASDEKPLKTRVTYYTDEERAIIKENAEGYYAGTKTSYINAAEKYLNYTYEDLWSVLPSQLVPRSAAVNQPKGCLNCGKAIDAYGNYPYTFNTDSAPWKLTCPSCKMQFPTNDFKSYYESGLDETGRFQPSKADPQYLKNTLYPEKGEKWGVDNGRGYIHTDGEKYFFIAYYNHWANWYEACQLPIKTLMNAYLYTGEQKYADRAIVFLNRFADLYPEYHLRDQKWADGFRHSGRDYGKIVGSIWEPGIIEAFLQAYDVLFYGFENLSAEALDFMKSKSNGKIKTVEDVMINIENGIYKQILPEVKRGNIRGNNGMHQRVLCLAAVVIDDPKLSKEWLEFAFKPSNSILTGLNIGATFVNDIDRDGMGNEASPHYNILWLGSYMTIAELLKGYTINGTDISYDLYENVKFKKMFTAMLNILLGESFTPNIGDADNTGSHVNYTYASYTLSAYLAYREPKFAQMLYWLYNGNTSSIVLGATEKDPTEIGKEIDALVKEHGELTFESQNLTGYGFTSLMNINNGESGKSYPAEKNFSVPASDISVINLGALSTVTRTSDNIVFTPSTVKDTMSLGFYLNNTDAVYDVIITANSVDNAGKFNVYVDGKLLQDGVQFPKGGKQDKVYFRRTINITPGYHVVSFEPAEGSVGPMDLASFTFIATTSASSKQNVNKETSLYMYYGRNSGHGHSDTLNMGIFAYNMDLMPDLGYPEYCDGTPNQVYWVSNTVSHNTVLVNDAKMGQQTISDPTHFDSTEFVKLISVDAPAVYSAAKVYSRTSALIRYDDSSSYAIDLFRVTGGKKHTYSFHPAESSGYVSEGLEFVPQVDSNGNYVGTLLSKSGAFGAGSSSSGYQWLKNVRKDNSPEDTFSMDWAIVDTRSTATANDVHLKLTMHGDYTSVYLTNGVPPTNKPGNPKQLDYLLVNNEGNNSNTDSLFVSVIEPYTGNPNIVSSEVVKVTENGKEVTDTGTRAVKVTFVNGRTDYIVYSADTTRKLSVADLFDFQGFFGVYSVRDGEVTTYVNDGVLIDKKTYTDRYTGKVVTFTKELSTENSITVKFDGSVDEKELIGRYVYISVGKTSVSYKILGVKKDGENYVLDVGDVTTVSTYKSTDPTKGYNYFFKENADITVKLSSGEADKEALSRLFKSTKSPITHLSLSHDLRVDAKAGDLVGTLFPVNSAVTKLYELPDYTYSVVEGYGDCEYFEVKDNGIYLKKDHADSGKSEYSIKVSAVSGTEAYYTTMTIDVLTKSKSKNQLYPELTLSETKENTDTTVQTVPSDPGEGENDPETPVEGDKGNSNVIVFVVIGAVIIIIAVAAVILIGKKKK